MKHLCFYFIAAALLSGCVSLTTPEQADLRRLEAQGVTTLSPQSDWERPAKPFAAGALNLLPGFGNFYLAAGNGYTSQTLTFSKPVTFDAIAITPTIPGGYSWSMGFVLTDIYYQ